MKIVLKKYIPSTTGAVLGFPVPGGANPLETPTYDFVIFSEKLHEIEKNLGRRGAPPPLDPPLHQNLPL